MIRIVLAEPSPGTWRLFRQPQWMSEVRSNPALASCPKLYFDIEEESYKTLLSSWGATTRDASLASLAASGAVEVKRG